MIKKFLSTLLNKKKGGELLVVIGCLYSSLNKYRIILDKFLKKYAISF